MKKKFNFTRIEAIKILENVGDKDDPAWEYATEDYYDEETDSMPSIYDVYRALGITFEEYVEASGSDGITRAHWNGEYIR